MAITWSMNNRYAASCVINGETPVTGFDIAFADHTRQPSTNPAAVFSSFANNLDLDVVDLPLINYLILRDMGKPVVAVPSFPTLFNPILGTMVNRQSGIRSPKDLEGRKVGVSGFCFNPATWLRGILTHHYDVQVDAIQWIENEPNSMSGVAYPRAKRFKIKQATGIMDMVRRGDIDAVIMSDGGIEPTEELDRLFPDFWTDIQAFHDATGVLPTNSVITIKQDTLTAHPGLAEAIASAFQAAWTRYSHEAPDDAAHMGLNVGELRKRGMFPHEDGLAANYASIRLMAQYAHEQGFITSTPAPEDLFVAV